MSSLIPNKVEKCKGAMIATAIGDALGWPNEVRAKNTSRNFEGNDEFIEWVRCCNYPYRHNDVIMAGEYSDDTQLTLSVARSIIAGNWEDVFEKKELPFWLMYERGGGSALLKAARSCKNGVLLWKSKHSVEYFNSGGNGAMMRILPHVVSYNSNDIKMLMNDIIRDSIITHGHPRAILGATCYAYALVYLLTKKSVLEYCELVTAVINAADVWGACPNDIIFKEWYEAAKNSSDYNYYQEWEYTRLRMIDKLKYIRDELKNGLISNDKNVLTNLDCFTKNNGAGDVTILSAIYFASKYANNPTLGLKIPAHSIGADTDTIASVTGGLLGMLCGTEWIPAKWRAVQDYNCIIQITELLLSENKIEASKEVTSKTKKRKNNWKNSPIGYVRKIDSSSLLEGKLTLTKYQSALGQTMYFKLDNTKMLQSIRPNGATRQFLHNEINCAGNNSFSYQFILQKNDIIKLIDQPMIQKKTFGKILKIIKLLIDNEEDNETIAKKCNVEREIVDEINTYIK